MKSNPHGSGAAPAKNAACVVSGSSYVGGAGSVPWIDDSHASALVRVAGGRPGVVKDRRRPEAMARRCRVIQEASAERRIKMLSRRPVLAGSMQLLRGSEAAVCQGHCIASRLSMSSTSMVQARSSARIQENELSGSLLSSKSGFLRGDSGNESVGSTTRLGSAIQQ